MTTEESLKRFADRVSKAKVLRKGPLAFRLSGKDGGDYFLDCSTGQARLSKGTPSDQVLLELIGDARRIIAVLEGKKDGRRQFLAGGFRVRGDLRYVSDLMLELGVIKEPF